MNLAPELKQLSDELNKEYGKGTVRFASDIPDVPSVSTGVFSLDVDVGGGVPLSKITMFVGPEHSGKTTIALKAIANAQHTDRDTLEPLEIGAEGNYFRPGGEEGSPMQCAYLNVEGAFGKDWARALGVDLDRLLELTVEYQEQAYDALAGLIRTGKVDMIVLDSLAMLTPSVESESSVEDQQMGLAARINNKGFRKLASVMNKLESGGGRAPALIIINQVRQKIGVMYGDPETLPGGMGQGFAASLIVRFRVTPKAIEGAGKMMVGREYHYKIKKNKITGYLREGSFKMYVEEFDGYAKGDVNNLEMIVDTATRMGLIERGGGWYTLGDQRMQGVAKVAAYLRENPDIYAQLESEVRKHLGKVA